MPAVVANDKCLDWCVASSTYNLHFFLITRIPRRCGSIYSAIMKPLSNGTQSFKGHESSTDASEIETRLFINGDFAAARSGATFPVINPADRSITAHVQEARAEDVELAVKAAEDALPQWAGKGGFERAAYLYRLATLYEQHSDALANLEARSMGRPIATYSKSDDRCVCFLQDTDL